MRIKTLKLKKLSNLPKRSVYGFLAILILSSSYLWWRPDKVHAQTDTFTTSGTWTVPANVSSAVFEAWGGGGAGGAAAGSSTAGGGGAGGQYAKKTLAGLVSAQVYTVTVATSTSGGSGNGSTGGDSSVTSPSSATVVLAKGGAGGLSDTNGGGPGSGSTTGGIGDTVFAGGSGSSAGVSCETGTGNFSGSGGGGAGSTGGGGGGCSPTAGSGTSLNGGNGGISNSSNGAGNAGSNYGGAGSGGFRSNGPTKSGGAGAQGLVTVTYTVANSSPNTPSLILPGSGASGVAVSPDLLMSATDPDGDSLYYKVFLYNTNASTGGNCTGSLNLTADGSSSPTGWDSGGTQYASGANATYTVQTSLSPGAGYCWQAQAIDPAGSNTWGSLSTASTFIINASPSQPSLLTPAAGATGISTIPSFTLRARDLDNNNLQYRIYLYQSDCSTPVGSSPFDMSGAGWSGMDAPGGTSYVGSSVLSSSTIATYTYQGTLSASTTYCWKADAIDPLGSNTYGSASLTQSFTTAGAGSSVTVQGGVTILGGDIIQ